MKKSKCTVRPASRVDLERFYGKREFPSVIARTFVVGGEPVGVVGICKDGARWVAFADIETAARAHPMTVVRETRKLKKYLDDVVGVRKMYAIADLKEPTSHKWLTNEGFMPLRGTLYVRG